MENAESGGEKFQLIRTLIAELHETQEQQCELQKTKTAYEQETLELIRLGEEFDKSRANLEEQLVQLGAARDELAAKLGEETAARQRVEQEALEIRSYLEKRLADAEAERDRISEELQQALKEWQRIEEEALEMKNGYEKRLADLEAERQRMDEERRREVHEWKAALDTLGERLINSRVLSESV